MEGEKPDIPRSINQWKREVKIYQAFGVDVLQIQPTKGCQDQVYVANVAMAIKPFIILANYKAPGRACEIPPAKKFFESMGYHCIQPPYVWEGEAETKQLRNNIYFGGYGKFTDIRAYQWLADKTGISVIPVREIKDEMYHLDTGLFVLDETNVLITEAAFDKKSLDRIAQAANITFTPKGIETTGITNGVSIPDKKIYCSGTFFPEEKDYRKAMEFLLTTMDKFGYSTVFIDVDTYAVSGGELSCSVMHLTF